MTAATQHDEIRLIVSASTVHAALVDVMHVERAPFAAALTAITDAL